MSEQGLDPWLDARLRNVRVPDDLAQRLHQVTTWTDGHVDAVLSDVPVDDSLCNRLHDMIEDVELDGRIKDVQIPTRFGKRLRRIATARRDRWLVLALATAATLFLSVGIPLLRPPPKPTGARKTNAPTGSLAANDQYQAGETVKPVDNDMTSGLPVNSSGLKIADSTNGLSQDQVAVDYSVGEPTAETTVSRGTPFHFLGARLSTDNLPDLESIPRLVHRGIVIPAESTFDQRFLFQHSLNPIVPIGDNRALHGVVIPPWTNDIGFRHNANDVRVGRLPHPRDVHVEDYLAAVDLQLPEVPVGKLGIRVAAGPSQFGSSADAQMILVSVRAGPTTQDVSTTVVGRNVSMRVIFNPEAVEAYRLIGHEPEAAGMVNAPTECILPEGRGALGLLEVWLRPNEENYVATVEVNWSDVMGIPQQPLRQPISRLQFATSMEEMPMSLQFATVVSQTAEVLRHSFFAQGKSKTLTHVLEFAEQVNPQLAERLSFRRFVKFVKQSNRLLGNGSSSF